MAARQPHRGARADRSSPGRAAGESFTTAINLDVCSNSERGVARPHPRPGLLEQRLGVRVLHRQRSERVRQPGEPVHDGERLDLHRLGGDPARQHRLHGQQSQRRRPRHRVRREPLRGDRRRRHRPAVSIPAAAATTTPPRISRSSTARSPASPAAAQPAPGNPFTGPGTTRCAPPSAPAASPSDAVPGDLLVGPAQPVPLRLRPRRRLRSLLHQRRRSGHLRRGQRRERSATSAGRPGKASCAQGQVEPCSSPATVEPDRPDHRLRAQRRHSSSRRAPSSPTASGPRQYDGTYLFADGGSGDIWVMNENGGVDYDDPFATGAFGLTDMAFGFDHGGPPWSSTTPLPTGGGRAPQRSRETNGVIPVLQDRPRDRSDHPDPRLRHRQRQRRVAGAAAGDMLNGHDARRRSRSAQRRPRRVW